MLQVRSGVSLSTTEQRISKLITPNVMGKRHIGPKVRGYHRYDTKLHLVVMLICNTADRLNYIFFHKNDYIYMIIRIVKSTPSHFMKQTNFLMLCCTS